MSIFDGKIYKKPIEKHFELLSSIFLYTCIVIALIISIFNVIFMSATVKGLSMWPNVNKDVSINGRDEISKNTDVVYYSSIFPVDYGDVIIVDLPRKEDDGIKRFIAKGGDVIGFNDIDSEDYYLYLNGSKLIEPYLNDISKNRTTIKNFLNVNNTSNSFVQEVFDKPYQYEIIVPEGSFLYLGDNRSVSADCSIYGPQPLSKLIGKVIIHLPYGYNVLTYYWSKLWGLV